MHHFLETEFKIDDVTMRGDVFKSVVRHLEGIAPSVFCSFAPKVLESVEVTVDGNEFLCSNCGSRSVPWPAPTRRTTLSAKS